MTVKIEEKHDAITLAKSVAPEDLVRGEYVAILNETYEYVSFLWNCDSTVLPPNIPIKIQWQSQSEGMPMKIVDICLPFIFIKEPNGTHRSLDMRKYQLVRLDESYAKRVWDILDTRKDEKSKKKSKKRRKKKKAKKN
jgi:hypothetical protein